MLVVLKVDLTADEKVVLKAGHLVDQTADLKAD